jgi:hypothetical protein
MKTRYLALIVAVSGLVLGCKTDPNQTLLERENFKQEVEIDKLRECVEQSKQEVEQSKQELQSCRRENAILREKSGLSPATSTPPSTPTSTPAAPAVQPPQIELPPEGMPQMPGSLERSNVAPPSPGDAPSTFKSPAASPPPDAPPYTPGSEPSSGPEPTLSRPGTDMRLNMNLESHPSTAPKVDSAYVERITLNPVMTGPYDSAGMPSDQGLTVLLETRNVRGQLVRAAAPVSVVVLDPSLRGEAARLARWDFSAAEVATMFRAMSGAEGLYLQMRWPAGPPKHSPLEVYVRLSAADGRKLETHRSIAMDASARPERQWAAKTAAAQGGAAPPRTGAKPDGWQQLPGPSLMPEPGPSLTPAPLAAAQNAPPPPVAAESLPELRAADAKKAAPKPAESKAELPVWSPYR